MRTTSNTYWLNAAGGNIAFRSCGMHDRHQLHRRLIGCSHPPCRISPSSIHRGSDRYSHLDIMIRKASSLRKYAFVRDHSLISRGKRKGLRRSSKVVRGSFRQKSRQYSKLFLRDANLQTGSDLHARLQQCPPRQSSPIMYSVESKAGRPLCCTIKMNLFLLGKGLRTSSARAQKENLRAIISLHSSRRRRNRRLQSKFVPISHT
jgi:hypothetical protein